MKVLINARDSMGYRRSGIGRYGLNVVENLVRKCRAGELELDICLSQEDVRADERTGKLVCDEVSGVGRAMADQKNFIVHKFSSPFTRLWFDHVNISRLVKKNGIDILHSFKFVLPLLISPPAHIKTVVTVHDLIFLDRPELFPFMTREYWKRCVRMSVNQASGVVVPSDFTRSRLAFHFGNEAASRCRVVHHGVDPVFLEAGKEVDRPPHNSSWDQGHKSGFFLCVGNLEPRKNLSGMLDALEIFYQKPTNRKIGLKWVGKVGWEDTKVLERVKKGNLDGRVSFLGRVDDVELARLYVCARGLVFPSLSEGFGLPVLEAMACGCPVIHSGRGALGEIGGNTQPIVEPTDAGNIARVMEKLAGNPQWSRELGEKGRIHASKFTWSSATNSVLSFYRELLTGGCH